MAFFSMQKLLCCICGVEFSTTINSTVTGYFKEAACTKKCLDEKWWRGTLSTMGKDYYPSKTKEEET